MRTTGLFQTPKFLLLIALAVVGPCLFSTAARADNTFLSVRPVFSDFDGDHRPDQAHLLSHGSHKQIHVHLEKSSSAKTLSFDSGMSDPGSLLSGDVDRDGDADLIWMSQTASPKFVFWMGDGHGNFTFISDPQTQSRLRRAFLYGNRNWNAVHQPKDDGPDGLVPTEDSITLGNSAVHVPIFIQSQNAKLPNKASVSSSPFLSALQKRGPPPIVHQ